MHGIHLTKLTVGPDVNPMRIAMGFPITMKKICVTCLKLVLKLMQQNGNMYLVKRNALLRIVVNNQTIKHFQQKFTL